MSMKSGSIKKASINRKQEKKGIASKIKTALPSAGIPEDENVEVALSSTIAEDMDLVAAGIESDTVNPIAVVKKTVSLSQEKMVDAEKNVATTEPLTALDLTGFTSPSDLKSRHRTRGGAGVITIVSTVKNGKRISLSQAVNLHLDEPDSVQIALSDEKILIAEHLPTIEGRYHLKNAGNKTIIYSTPLVSECIDRYSLDYTDRTTRTFYEAEYGMSESGPYVSVKVL